MDLNFINMLLDGNIVLGKKMEINENLLIIPVYKSKISFLNLKSDVKNSNNDGASGNININPICLLKISENNIDIIHLEKEKDKDSLTQVIPNLLNNIDINELLKTVKF